MKAGLLSLLSGAGIGLRSFLGRLTGPDPTAQDFANKQERMWATTGWKIALGLAVLGLVLVVVGTLA